jgi:hypothetical protein
VVWESRRFIGTGDAEGLSGEVRRDKGGLFGVKLSSTQRLSE